MKKLTVFLVVLLGGWHFSVAAPQVRSENKTMIDIQGEISGQPPMPQSKGPGILLCPEQQQPGGKELSFLDKHSSDCRPTDKLNGEIKESDEATEVK
ncbi:MAG: hypothetical protein ACKOX6_04650 [Bdellovibrio sp.]